MRLWVLYAACGSVLFTSTGALAQERTQNTGKKLQIRSGAENARTSASAREQMAAGRWGACIALFDRAIERSIDPTLRRDRGICHDKLDEPYPAMDDYRAYLTARPEARDAGRIGERLSELQEATGVARGKLQQEPGQIPAQSARPANDKPAQFDDSTGTGSASASTSTSTGTATATATDDSSSSSIQFDTSGGRKTNYDQQSRIENDSADSLDSPVRFGTGFIIGPFFDLRWSTKTGGDPLYAFGASPRYSVSRMFTIGADLGFVGTGTIGAANAASGIRATVFAEGRIPLNATMHDAVIVSAGGGYERYNQANTRAVLNAPLLRAKVGYRHVFGNRVGLEVGGMADVIFFSSDNVPVGAASSSTTDVYLGMFSGLVIGF